MSLQTRTVKDRGVALRPGKPEWLKIRVSGGDTTAHLRRLMRERGLHTVCEEARCPNMAECWSAGTATFMILGDVCTRSCGFCAVKTGRPLELDMDEPGKVAEAVGIMGVRHAVITSVNRDELPDGGASLFAETIRRVRHRNPDVTIEVLIPDFRGDLSAVDQVIAEGPDILNHNVETVPRLYATVRPQARYARSLRVIRHAGENGMVTKAGMMLGLGETQPEVRTVMADLHSNGCRILTLGQYLQPTKAHLPVDRYLTPAEFETFRAEGYRIGFRHIEAGPLVRSSYHAERHVIRVDSPLENL